MKKQLNQVNEFHKVFKVYDEAPAEPTLITEPEYLLRYNLLTEEKREYLDACKEGDLVKVFDSLGDQLYVIVGTILLHGGQRVIEDVFDAIQASNMSKLDDNFEPILREDGKVLKSKNYFPPNIADVLK
jgi:predicted HAD superfamily Cof-like phosphohydrolase